MEKKAKSAKELNELVEGLIKEYGVERGFEDMLSEFADELFDTEKEKDDFYNEIMDIVHNYISRLICEILLKINK